MTARDIINKAKGELGVTEYPPDSNNVKYNTWYYGREVSGPEYPWCAVFISWLFKAEQGLCKKTASCVQMLEWFEQKKQLVKFPQPGDIVFFKYSTNNRRTNHVGLVVSVDGNVINTIEGNTSAKGSQDNGGKVMQRNRYSNIVAYARPKYHATDTFKDKKPTLKLGSRGDWVRIAQGRLVVHGIPVDVDGIFMEQTKKAVIQFQKNNKLVPDGVIGPVTWDALYK